MNSRRERGGSAAPGGGRSGDTGRRRESGAGRGLPARKAVVALVGVGLILGGLGSAHAQDQRRRKVPGLDKVIGGTSRGAFSGKVLSLDLKDKVLNLVSAEGQNTEVFPVPKKVQVVAANGARMDLKSLAPGTNVLVYYSQRGDRRQVKQIVVLAASPAPGKTSSKSSPPS